MANDETDLDNETPEQTVIRIREHLRDAESKRITNPMAAKSHEDRAAELIRVLTERQLGTIKAVAIKLLGKNFEMYEEGIVEISLELDRAIRLFDTRPLLETKFSAAFWGIAMDGADKARASNRRVSGVQAGKVPVLSGSEGREGGEGEMLDSLVESEDDAKALSKFEEVLDAEHIKAICEKMPARQRKVLTLRMQGYDFQEIADQLQINRDTASAEHTRAHKFIQNQVALEARRG